MNRILAILLLCCSTVQATDVRFNFQSALHLTGPVSNRVVRLTPVSSPVAEGGIIIAREPITTNSYTGTIIVSNMSPQRWTVTLNTPITPTTFTIDVPDTNTLVEASEIMTVAAAPSGTYTTTAANARFVLKNSGWASNLIVTNLTLPEGAVSGYVWTATNSNGRGEWRVGGSGGGSNYLFNANQFSAAAGGTNFSIKSGAKLTNGDFFGTTTFDIGSFITDQTGSETWNFKTVVGSGPDGATVARIADITAATNGHVTASITNGLATTNFVNSLTNDYNPTQFSISAGRTVNAASGIQVTNVDANGLTNRGPPIVLRGSSTVLQHTNGAFYGMGLLTDGTNATWQTVQRTSQPLLWKTVAAMAQNSPLMVIFMGDSLLSTPDPLCNEIVENFAQNYGFSGGAGAHMVREYGRFGKRWGVDAGGTTYYTNDLSRWYAWHTVLPNSGDFVQHGSWYEGVGSGSYYVTGNVFEVVYAVSNTYSGFSIATNGVVLTNIVCNAAPGVLETNRVWRYTNAAGPIGVTMRETSLSNSAGGVRIFSGAIWDNTRPGIVFNEQAAPSMTLAQFNSVPTNSMGPIFASWANVMPTLVMFKTVNSPTTISNQLPTLNAFWNFNMPSAEKVIHAVHPVESNDSDVVAENYALQLACTNGLFTNAYYFPTHEIFGDSFNIGYRQGYLVTGGDVHLYQEGANFCAGKLWDWMNLQGARGVTLPGPQQKVPRVLRNLDGIVSLAHSNGFPYSFQAKTSQGTNIWQVGTNGMVESFGQVATNPVVVVKAPSNQATNIVEVMRGSSVLAGFNSNAVAFLQISNSATAYPAQYTLFNQTADGVSCTNLGVNTFASILGTGVGSLTLPANFWQVGRSARGEWYGQYWTGASPGNTYVVVKLGSLVVCSNLFAITGSMTQRPFYADVNITCRTNSASVGALVATGKLNFPSGAAFVVQAFTNLLTITDTTAAMAFDIQATNLVSTTSIQTQNGNLSLR
jgi:hypothetical protein